MSLITGAVAPTSGSALVAGFDMVQQHELACRQLGVCPQVRGGPGGGGCLPACLRLRERTRKYAIAPSIPGCMRLWEPTRTLSQLDPPELAKRTLKLACAGFGGRLSAQMDVLFDFLTVRDHLQLFSGIKVCAPPLPPSLLSFPRLPLFTASTAVWTRQRWGVGVGVRCLSRCGTPCACAVPRG